MRREAAGGRKHCPAAPDTRCTRCRHSNRNCMFGALLALLRRPPDELPAALLPTFDGLVAHCLGMLVMEMQYFQPAQVRQGAWC